MGRPARHGAELCGCAYRRVNTNTVGVNMADKGTVSKVLGALTGGGTVPMTEGIRKTEEKREAKLQKQIDDLKSPELVPGKPLAATTPEALNTAAETEAQKTMKKKKRTLLNTGGNTDITAGQGILAAGQVSKKTLLGG